MFDAIGQATRNINLETFIIRDDEVGRSLADLLIEKRRQGVRVKFIYDSFGAIRTPQSFFDRMKDAGIHVFEFNPIGSLSLTNMNNRDHRKILVVDGQVAFTGGVNFYDVYSEMSSVITIDQESREEKKHWRDTHLRVEGPAVESLQKLFFETWDMKYGPSLPDGEYFPPLRKEGDSLVRVVGSAPDQPIPHIYATYVSAILHAERSIHLTQAYLIPNGEVLNGLAQAASRGVDVKVIVPGSSDFWMPIWAGRANYEQLLKAGVRIYERGGGVLHSKTAVIDGVWSTVGSSNMDSRSFLHDAEVNVVILGREFGERMEEMFEWDLSQSEEVRLESWEKRALTDRIREWVAQRFKYWL